METKYKPQHIVWGLVAVNLVWRLIWLPVSRGAHTDGILQITAFREGFTYWPPVYTILAYLFAWIPPLGLEGSARLVSAIAGALAVWPIEYVGRKLFGQRAALLGVIAYTLSPIPLRWSLQPMSDATFTAFWMGSLAMVMQATAAAWPDLFEQGSVKPAPDMRAAGKWILFGSALGALAALTRYQGMLLLPVAVVVILKIQKAAMKDEGKAGIPPVVALAPWLLCVAWGVALLALKEPGQGHADQIAGRTGPNVGATLLNYLYLLEQFVLISPYFVTYGIFGFFLFGLLRINFATKRILNGVLVGTYLTVGLLLMQTVFQAFQSRYMAPLVPFVCLIAGHGMGVWEKRCKDKPKRFYGLLAPTLAYAVVFSCLVAYYQGSPFLDVKKAGQWLKENAPMVEGEEGRTGPRVFTIEVYGDLEFKPAKLAYWSGRKESEIGHYQGQPVLEGGDYLVLSSFYGAVGVPHLAKGGYGMYRELLDKILADEYNLAKLDASTRYAAEEVAKFDSLSIPLLPDIMEEPLTHTNPLAWHLRYRPQRFETTIFRVPTIEDYIESRSAGDATPSAGSGSDETVGEVVETFDEEPATDAAADAPAADAPAEEAPAEEPAPAEGE